MEVWILFRQKVPNAFAVLKAVGRKVFMKNIKLLKIFHALTRFFLGIKNMEQNVKCVCHSDLSYQNCQTQKIERNEKYCSQFPLFVCVLSDSLSLLH